MQHSRNVYDHDHEHRFNPNDGDSCYIRINPNENVWEKGLVLRKVIRVPDSYVVELDGCRYHRNKCDLTLSLQMTTTMKVKVTVTRLTRMCQWQQQ